MPASGLDDTRAESRMLKSGCEDGVVITIKFNIVEYKWGI
jgi:hypothetical protein